MNIMERIEQTIKKAVLDTALRHLFARSASPAQRIARTMVDFGCALYQAVLTDQEQAQLYEQLLPLVQEKNQEQAARCLLDHFHL